MRVRAYERERERERDRDRDRETETERERQRQRNRCTKRQNEHTDIGTDENGISMQFMRLIFSSVQGFIML